MINRTSKSEDTLSRDRMVVIAPPAQQGALVNRLREFYPDWSFSTADTYLSAIADVARRPVRAVLACADPAIGRPEQAVAGLRSAAGEEAKLILCCTPESESVTRRALTGGADDYLLLPLDGDEMDAAVGYVRPAALTEQTFAPAPAVSTAELTQLAATLAQLDARPMALVEELAKLIHLAMGTRGATVIVEGAVATSGDVVTKPVLSAPIEGTDGIIGQLTLTERIDGPFTPGDTEKLEHYATLAGHLLQAAVGQREWRRLALTDECTGLPNRRYLQRELDRILARAAQERFQVTILLFDVDDFKQYNDEYGHDAGDEVLRETGKLFREHCREQDIVTRYGGDEFAVVFWDPQGPRSVGSKHPAGVLAVLDRFKSALQSHRFPKLGPSGVGLLTISGGLATYPWNASTGADLVTQADQALLTAKRNGKNRILLVGE